MVLSSYSIWGFDGAPLSYLVLKNEHGYPHSYAMPSQYSQNFSDSHIEDERKYWYSALCTLISIFSNFYGKLTHDHDHDGDDNDNSWNSNKLITLIYFPGRVIWILYLQASTAAFGGTG